MKSALCRSKAPLMRVQSLCQMSRKSAIRVKTASYRQLHASKSELEVRVTPDSGKFSTKRAPPADRSCLFCFSEQNRGPRHLRGSRGPRAKATAGRYQIRSIDETKYVVRKTIAITSPITRVRIEHLLCRRHRMSMCRTKPQPACNLYKAPICRGERFRITETNAIWRALLHSVLTTIYQVDFAPQTTSRIRRI
jgi:hypothetical protein